MILNELNPIIQSWVDSDNFIDSVVSVAQEFTLLSTAPLIEVTFGLILKTIKPEEFKTSLLASLPPDKQNEAIVSSLVHASLLPIKGPLAESGIDISTIIPLDETLSSPYIPPVPEITTKISISEPLSTSLDESAISPSVTPEALTSPNPSESLIVPLNEVSAFPQPVASVSSAPTKTATIESELISSDIAPAHPTETATTSSFNHSDAPSPLPVNEHAPINNPLSSPTPFVIHKEKTIERTSQDFDHAKELLRPLFYSKQIEKEEPSSFVNLEFKPPENNDNKN